MRRLSDPGLPRRLALVVEPGEGESLVSWLDRLAADMRRPPGLVADDLGLTDPRSRRGVPLLFGLRPADGAAAAVHAATGVSERIFDAMHLSAYDGTVLDLSGLVSDKASVQRVRQREWALFNASRACPDCLAESGGIWKLWWRLAGAAVCPAHRRVLISDCPGCGLELRCGTVKHQSLPSRQDLVDPSRCANRAGREMCRFPLAAAPFLPATDEVCAAQLSYLAAADGHPHPIAGQRVTSAGWTWAFTVLCGMIRFAAMELELPPAVPAAAVDAFVADARQRASVPMGRAAGYRGMPRSALLATALLAFAGSVLCARDGDQLRDALRPLGQAIAAGGLSERRRTLWAWPMPPLLRQSLLSVIPTPGASWGWVAVHGSMAAVDRSWDRRDGLEFRHLPRVVAAADFAELVAPWLRTDDRLGGRVSALAGRRFASLSLARLCGAKSWTHAAVVLGWRKRSGQSVGDRIAHVVVDPHGFWQAIGALADRLQQRGAVDYDSRRRALSAFDGVDRATWEPVFARYGVSLSQPRCMAVAAWLWTILTCDELVDAPAIANPDWATASLNARLRSCQILSDRLPAGLAEELVTFGQSLVGRAATGFASSTGGSGRDKRWIADDAIRHCLPARPWPSSSW